MLKKGPKMCPEWAKVSIFNETIKTINLSNHETKSQNYYQRVYLWPKGQG